MLCASTPAASLGEELLIGLSFPDPEETSAVVDEGEDSEAVGGDGRLLLSSSS